MEISSPELSQTIIRNEEAFVEISPVRSKPEHPELSLHELKDISLASVIDKQKEKEVEHELQFLGESSEKMAHYADACNLASVIDFGVRLNSIIAGTEENRNGQATRAVAVALLGTIPHLIHHPVFGEDVRRTADFIAVNWGIALAADALPPITKAEKKHQHKVYEKMLQRIQNGEPMDKKVIAEQLLANKVLPADKGLAWLRGELTEDDKRNPTLQMLDELMEARHTYIKESGNYSPSQVFLREKEERMEILRDVLLAEFAAHEKRSTPLYQTKLIARGIGDRALAYLGIHAVGNAFKLAQLSGDTGKMIGSLADDTVIQTPRIAQGARTLLGVIKNKFV